MLAYLEVEAGRLFGRQTGPSTDVPHNRLNILLDRVATYLHHEKQASEVGCSIPVPNWQYHDTLFSFSLHGLFNCAGLHQRCVANSIHGLVLAFRYTIGYLYANGRHKETTQHPKCCRQRYFVPQAEMTAFWRELSNIAWCPVLAEAPEPYLPWSPGTEAVAPPRAVRPPSDTWLVSATLRILDGECRSALLTPLPPLLPHTYCPLSLPSSANIGEVGDFKWFRSCSIAAHWGLAFLNRDR